MSVSMFLKKILSVIVQLLPSFTVLVRVRIRIGDVKFDVIISLIVPQAQAEV